MQQQNKIILKSQKCGLLRRMKIKFYTFNFILLQFLYNSKFPSKFGNEIIMHF
jgi:hypothetical protein